MSGSYILEISVQTIAMALAAERGGAHRIELCADLGVGGLTPSAELMRAIREQIRLPIFAMVRPRGGDFVYSDAEFASMQRDIAGTKELRMDGVVFGLLTREQRVDTARTRELVELARPLPVTFHRAFDQAANLPEALEDVIETGATRILTSGGAPTAPEGLAALAELVATADDRVIIVPGSGINPGNVAQVARQTRAREFHSGLGSVIDYGADKTAIFGDEVRKLSGELARATRAD